MFTEIVKFLPRLDQADLRKMEQTLSGRFKRLAKSFGGGLAKAIKGGGVLGAITVVLDKLLNPLKEVQEAIDRTLTTASDTVSRAQQLGTTSGRLMKLQTFARSKGLNDEELYNMIGKYQSAIIKARENPNEPSNVANFVGYDDMVEGFYHFIHSMNALSNDQRYLVQEQLLGQKQVLKAADFLNSIEDLDKIYGSLDSEKMTRALDKMNSLTDVENRLKGTREWNDMVTKGNIVNESMIHARDKSERQNLARENARINQYENLQAIANTSDSVVNLLEKGLQEFGGFVRFLTPKVTQTVEKIDKLISSPMFKGIFKFGKGE